MGSPRTASRPGRLGQGQGGREGERPGHHRTGRHGQARHGGERRLHRHEDQGPGKSERPGPDQSGNVAAPARPATPPTAGCGDGGRPAATRAGRRRERPAPTSPKGAGRGPARLPRPALGPAPGPDAVSPVAPAFGHGHSRRAPSRAGRRWRICSDRRRRSARGPVGPGLPGAAGPPAGPGVVMVPVGFRWSRRDPGGRRDQMARRRRTGRPGQRRPHRPGGGPSTADAGGDAHAPQAAPATARAGRAASVLLDRAPPGSGGPPRYWGKAPSHRVTRAVEGRAVQAEQRGQLGEARRDQLFVVHGARGARRRTAPPRPGSARPRAGPGGATCGPGRCTR